MRIKGYNVPIRRKDVAEIRIDSFQDDYSKERKSPKPVAGSSESMPLQKDDASCAVRRPMDCKEHRRR
jgi:hypothetical protein